MKPLLNKNISIQVFQNTYWLKEELIKFCRNIGLTASGGKIDITNRIQKYLETGKIEKTLTEVKKKETKKFNDKNLNLETIITTDHRCSQNVRIFFKKAIGSNFHFSTYIQNYFKKNVGGKYEDVVKAWFEEEERIKVGTALKIIAPQFKYNNYFRDFFSDPNNKSKKRSDAIDSWNKRKSIPGDHKYSLKEGF